MNKGIEFLQALSLDLNWTWHREIDKIWEHLDKVVWERTHNPCVVLQTVSERKLQQLLEDPYFQNILKEVEEGRQKAKQTPSWFQQNYPPKSLSCIAYFSMEFMLNEALPIYSGGLGNVAGDQLKAASDLGVPVIGVGLLYQQGYFRQMITRDGSQQALYPYNDPDQLPIKPLRDQNGEWVRIEIGFPGWSLLLRAWEAKIGCVKLYLLDSNDAVNFPIHRGITSELYGGDIELRLKQEIILGIGGWKLLTKMGIRPDVCHLNEGHAAFAVLERALNCMKEQQIPFKTALCATRAGNLFTTHTAVPAGFDRFSPFLMKQYMEKYAILLNIPFEELLALGRLNPDDPNEYFNMAYLAIRGSGAVGGVSELHKKVSRHIFQPLFPRWPEHEVPIGSITNGVHVPSWESEAANKLWTEQCGKARWKGLCQETKICQVSDARLWQMRNEARKEVINYARARVCIQMEARGNSAEEIAEVKNLFDPNRLTLGFARRFATYKRPNLLLHDPERWERLLTDRKHPIQLIIAGKAHPADLPGQAMIKQWIEFIQRPGIRGHLIFLSDYDMYVTEKLVQGVDVWINTPRRPWEACGTSGMKVLVNGGLNLSELDGWWVEAYTPEVGWALGDGKDHGDDPSWDNIEANALYDLLEKEIIPQYYERNNEGVPTRWISRVRSSMTQLTPRFSAARSVTEYTEKYYFPAALKYQKRILDSAALAKKMIDWQEALKAHWDSLRFGSIKVENQNGHLLYEIEVTLNQLDPSSLNVELYAEGEPPELYKMERVQELSQKPSTYLYRITFETHRPASDYTARLVPYFEETSLPLEANYILWNY